MSDTSNTEAAPAVEVNADEVTVEQTVLPSEPVESESTEAPADDEETQVEAPDAPKEESADAVDPDAGMRHE